MAGGNSVWAIEIGKCALKALKMRAAGDGKVEILAYDLVEHPKVLSQPDADRDTLIANALEKFLSRNDITNSRVVVGVPGQHTLARFSKLPPVEAKKIPDIVRYEADQQIPFDMDEVIWDYQTFQKEGSTELEVGIFAMKRELIREHLHHFENVGIEPVLVQAGPLALYNAAHFEGMLGEQTTVLLDIGAENTDLIIGTPDGLWTRTIPLGGNIFTEALVKSFKLSFSKAENLKRSAETSKYRRQIFQAVRPVFADLVQELSRSIGFYTSTHKDAQLAKIVGLGNAFNLPGLEKYLEQNLQMSLKKPSKLERVAPSAVSESDTFKEQLLNYIGCYGLGLQGLGMSKIVSNLLPFEIARQVTWSKKKHYFAAAAACLMVSGIAIWGRYWNDLGTLRTHAGNGVPKVTLDRAMDIERAGLGQLQPHEYGETWLRVAQALQTEWKGLSGKGGDKEKQITEIVALQRDKSLWPKILAVIHESLPTVPEDSGQDWTSADYVRAAKEHKRVERKQVVVTSFAADFINNLDGVALSKDSCDQSTAHEIPKPGNENRKGFLVVIDFVSPTEDAIHFVCTEVVPALREAGRQPDQGFYFNRVVMSVANPLGKAGLVTTDRPAAPQEAQPTQQRQTRDPGGNRGGSPTPGAPKGNRGGGPGKPKGAGPPKGSGSGPSRGPAQPPPGGDSTPNYEGQKHDPTLDPLTEESIEKDWQFQIQLDVVLGDLPAAASAETAGATKK